ncbi:cupin domain-containing protein [Dermatobacter hominis]|uniref:cupin domain-containing protein n=1 Tax=Dermatobacter hominis TaxID=2884263 RepID=UPI001D118014|nr:cupin domain-containing protein [Dermatobacter hominis]UDY33949.1 cupin domain-containing protein [Dermatobacter hominis]
MQQSVDPVAAARGVAITGDLGARGTVLSLTPSGGDAEEQALYEAAERSRTAAVAALASMVPGWDVDEATTSLGGARASAFDVGATELPFADVAGAVDAYLAGGDLRSWRASLVDPADGLPVQLPQQFKARDTAPDPVGRANPFAVADAVRSGRTLVLNQSETQVGSDWALLVDVIATAFRAPTQINTYVSAGLAQGFGSHWDDHDVLIVQAHGRKYWEVSFPGALAPIRQVVVDDASGEVAWSGILEPGWAVYIPRGWPHRVNGFVDESSVHLTYSIRRANLIDVLGSVPPERLTAEIERSDLEHGLGYFRSQITPFPRTGPITTLDAVTDGLRGATLRVRLPGGMVFVRTSELRGDVIHIAGNMQSMAIHRNVVPALCALLDGASHIDELAERCSLAPDELRAAIVQLGEAGLVEIGRVGSR